MTGIASLFKKKKIDPEEAVRHWKITMRGEERKLDRQLRSIEAEEVKIKRELKNCAKRNDRESLNVLAKEMIHSKKAKERLHTNKAQMHSVVMQMKQNLATAKVMGHLENSTEIMALMNSLVKVPEVMETMRVMEQEMTKAGIIEEMVDNVMDTDDVEVEDASQEAVDSILMEVLGAEMTKAGIVPAQNLPASPAAAEKVEDEPEMPDLQKRLKQLQTAN